MSVRVRLARLRAALTAKGLTPKPVCGMCGKQVDPKAWGKAACKPCEAERAEVADYWAAEHEAATYDAWRNR